MWQKTINLRNQGSFDKKFDFFSQTLSHIPRWVRLVQKTRVKNSHAWAPLRLGCLASRSVKNLGLQEGLNSPTLLRLGCLASRSLIFHYTASLIYLGLQEGLNSPPLLRLGFLASRSLISQFSASLIPGPAEGAELSPSLEAGMLGL
jgi:hypothetical protein